MTELQNPALSHAARILVVEDDVLQREVLLLRLRAAGYAVQGAGDGRAALDALAQAPRPDLIITDLVMPEVDGMELIAQLRAGLPLRDLPIIILSSVDLPAERAQAAVHNVVRYLVKPVQSRDLLAAVAEALAASASRLD